MSKIVIVKWLLPSGAPCSRSTISSRTEWRTWLLNWWEKIARLNSSSKKVELCFFLQLSPILDVHLQPLPCNSKGFDNLTFRRFWQRCSTCGSCPEEQRQWWLLAMFFLSQDLSQLQEYSLLQTYHDFLIEKDKRFNTIHINIWLNNSFN